MSKACKDCRFLTCVSTAHYELFSHVPEAYLVCRPPIATGADLVYGTLLPAQYSPRGARMDNRLCGLDAVWFEPIEKRASSFGDEGSNK
jgi:hypothetical protein